ncbi:MAG TPA: hypothetical protein VE174_09400 [Actinomycetota bacterium]|nr:hypothetical protein [Actinomycetota bacterium]
MTDETWRNILVAALAVNAAIGFGYRVYRLAKGGPIADVWGQAVLGVLLALIAMAVAFGLDWARWIAVGYGLLFGLVVMPVWVLGVLLPMRPRALDYAFTGVYWGLLLLIAVAGFVA